MSQTLVEKAKRSRNRAREIVLDPGDLELCKAFLCGEVSAVQVAAAKEFKSKAQGYVFLARVTRVLVLAGKLKIK